MRRCIDEDEQTDQGGKSQGQAACSHHESRTRVKMLHGTPYGHSCRTAVGQATIHDRKGKEPVGRDRSVYDKKGRDITLRATRSRICPHDMNDSTTTNKLPRSPAVPRKYAGQWIAWDHEHSRIIASSTTYAEARNAALAAGENDPLLDKVPRADVRFVGGGPQ